MPWPLAILLEEETTLHRDEPTMIGFGVTIVQFFPGLSGMWQA